MKILFLSNNSLDALSGGIERTTFNLIKGLANDNAYIIYAVFLKIPLKIYNVICIEDTIITGKQINDYIITNGIDVVVFPGGAWYTNLLKSYDKNIDCKIITCLHSPPKAGEDNILKNADLEWKNKNIKSKMFFLPNYISTYIRHPWHSYKVKRSYGEAYVNSDAYVLLSKSFFSTFKDYARLNDIDKLFAIGNALSFDTEYKVEENHKKKDTVLVVSRFDEANKRISYGIKLWALINTKNWVFKIVGFGKDEIYYHQLIRELNLSNVSIEGKQSPIEFYKEAKIFLMTSSFEGWGMTINEAMQMGCVPIVMDSFSSLHDIVTDGYNGVIVKNDDIEGMANATFKLMNDNELRDRLSANGILSCSRFTIEKITDQWKELFQQLIYKK